jgi:bifunctional non-homologous end joining protein LigD
MARRAAAGLRFYTRNSRDFSKRFPQVVAAVRRCRCAPACSTATLSATTAARGVRSDLFVASRPRALNCAFDLLEFDGQDLRRLPIEERKARLARALPKPSPGITLNEHFAGDGELTLARAVFAVEEKPAGRFTIRTSTTRIHCTVPLGPV